MGVPAVPRTLRLTVEISREVDGRWIAEVPELPGVMVYGETEQAAVTAAQVSAVKLWRWGGKGAPLFPVELVLKGGKSVTVSREDAEGPSRDLARRLAERLGVPLEDRA